MTRPLKALKEQRMKTMRTVMPAALIAAMAIGACTAPGYKGQLQSWVGKSNSELVNTWGEPAEVVNDAEGRPVFVYATVRTETKGGTSMGDPITGQPIKLSKAKTVKTFWCKTTFTIGEDERVEDFTYEGNDCEKR
jgi:hypothetical protein